jgi:hypothetical protein
MMVDVIGVKVLEGHRLWLEFDDGAKGEFDFARTLGFDGVFAPLQDTEYFAIARLDPDLGSVAWPNGTDVDPLVLHAAITGHALQVG